MRDKTGSHHSVVCFLAQQTAENALKGILIAAGEPVGRVHSLKALQEKAVAIFGELEPLREAVKFLDQFYITTRYPDAVAYPLIPATSFDQDDAERATRYAEEILRQVHSVYRQLLAQGGHGD